MKKLMYQLRKNKMIVLAVVAVGGWWFLRNK